MSRETICAEGAPKAIGPYAQAIATASLVFTSGQIPLDPATGLVVEGGIEIQTRRVLENLAAVLAGAGTSLSKALKTTVFLKDMGDFAAMNGVYQEFFPEAPPARSTVEVARLPKDVRVEIEVIAAR